MQLKTGPPPRGAVAALAAALVGQAAPGQAQTLQTDASLLLYTEPDRVTAVEGTAYLRKQLAHQNELRLDLTFDAMTGASPIGATPARIPQTFTRSSGGGTVEIAPGNLPLDPGFQDERFGLDAQLLHPLDAFSKWSVGARVSIERDYTSLAASSGITRGFNRRNTTVGVSASVAHEISSPKGGAPVPYASMPLPAEPESSGKHGEEEEDDFPGQPRNVYDLVAGISQVLDRQTVVRVNYSLDYASGYLNEPYKLISVLYGPTSPVAGNPSDYIYERRPRSRTRNALYGQILRALAGTVIDASFRHFWDTWGIRSATVDVAWRVPVHRGLSVEPHVRWYRQTEADFYEPFWIKGENLPAYASADSRLAAFDAYTLGVNYSFPIRPGVHLNATTEYYFQKGDKSPPQAFGPLRDFDLFPKLHALMLRVGVSHDL